MANEADSASGMGILGFIGLLTVFFIALKLHNILYWSWWLVLAPLWATVAVALALLGVALGVSIWCTDRQ